MTRRASRIYGVSGGYARTLARTRRSIAMAFALLGVIAMGFGGIAAADLVRRTGGIGDALFVIALAGGAVALLFFARRFWRAASAAAIGAHAEIVMARRIDALCAAQGWEARHDVRGVGGNIDHVITSPHGIVLVETKAYHVARPNDPRLHAATRYLARQIEATRRARRHAANVSGVVALPLCTKGSSFMIGPIAVICGAPATMTDDLRRIVGGA